MKHLVPVASLLAAALASGPAFGDVVATTVDGIALPGVTPALARLDGGPEARAPGGGGRGGAPRSSVPSRPSVAPVGAITVKAGTTEVLPVAAAHLNRIATPFEQPTLRSSAPGLSAMTEGNVLYLSVTGDAPAEVFLSDANNPDPTVALLLMPQRIPPANITLDVEGYAARATPNAARRRVADLAEAGSFEAKAPFQEMLVSAFRALAEERLPQGFGLATLDEGTAPVSCSVNGATVSFGQEVSGSSIAIYVARATNNSPARLTIDETACAGSSVLAVAAWPHTELAPGQSTELFVAVRLALPSRDLPRPALTESQP